MSVSLLSSVASITFTLVEAFALDLIQVRFKSNYKFSNGGLDLYAIKEMSHNYSNTSKMYCRICVEILCYATEW